MRLEEYLELLSVDTAQQAASFPDFIVNSLYFGGGTPSLLTPQQVESLIKKIRSCFHLTENAEVTLEVNPGTASPESLQGYRAAGVNRLSIGIQSLHDAELTILGRIHSAQEAIGTVASAKLAGFENISIDLMHSLPWQSLTDWESTLQGAISLNPSHISAYGLSVEADTPMAEMVTKGELTLPEEELSAKMFEMTAEILVDAGFEHYEVSNFARPDYRSRHNQVYWRRGNYLGFGAGAHSFVREPDYGVRWENPEGLQEYCEFLQGDVSVSQGKAVSRHEAMSELFFLGLRLLDGVNLEEFRAEFGMDATDAFPGVIEKFVCNGLLLRQGDNLRFSRKGLLLSNQMLCEFV